MRLYAADSKQFIEDTIQNRIADTLKDSFFKTFRFYPPHSEVLSWRNSLRAISQVFQYANLLDHGIALEYQLPLTSKRLDCFICGKNEKQKDNTVIIELKQWENCKPADGENEVLTWVGGAEREVAHPSVQVGQYVQFMQQGHTSFYEDDPIDLTACAYLHNYSFTPDDVLRSPKFEGTLERYPVFSQDDVNPLVSFLQGRLSGGRGREVMTRIEQGKNRPSKQLMEHIRELIKGNGRYVLLDEQLVVYDKVFALIREAQRSGEKGVVIIKGGPGTGKSVVAMNLLADLLHDEKNAQYATGSRAFTENLRSIFHGISGAHQMFSYFNQFGRVQKNSVDVLICDEAHRIRETSANRFTKAADRTDKPQVQELIEASKISVFFIDDNQVVRPDEIGSASYISDFANKHKYKLYEYELVHQFRCGGSDAYVNWINNTLMIKPTAHVLWDKDQEFEFKIFDTPQELDAAIREKAAEGFTARISAGFCWPWSEANPDGTLVNDVVIGDYARPWNAKPESKRLAPGIPKATLWATDPNGIDQIGCIYTAQGFEYQYNGVIFGKDLVYDPKLGEWVSDKEYSYDRKVKQSKDAFVDLVKNTYRVLLTRGIKGCYVYFEDENTRNFFRSRIE